MLEAVDLRAEETRRVPLIFVPPSSDMDPDLMQSHAHKLAAGLAWIPSVRTSNALSKRAFALTAELRKSLTKAASSDTVRRSTPLLQSSLHDVTDSFRSLRMLPHVKTPDGMVVPRILAIGRGFAKVCDWHWNERSFLLYIETFQHTAVLNLAELRALNSVLVLLWLENISDKLSKPGSAEPQLTACLDDIRQINHVDWWAFIEPLVLFDRYLQKDPAEFYLKMESESRNRYRNEVAYIAQYSDASEVEVAKAALLLAENAKREPNSDPRMVLRVTHIGYYLVAEGAPKLWQKVSFRPPVGCRTQILVKNHADDFYIPTLVFLTVALAGSIAELLGMAQVDFWMSLLMLTALLLPCSEAAVQLTNYFFTSLLEPAALPKLDFNRGIPASCTTIVAVPALLLNQDQVQRLVDELEVRFLGNSDPNLHFALLTDLPDSLQAPKEEDSLAAFCGELIEKLNRKYAAEQRGSFFLFHRKRLYNPREQSWMGWERKRGKLLEFNQYLRAGSVPYALETGDLSIISTVRFVISLDADTLLPRGTAKRLIGTIAHPLNQGIVDPERNVVVSGYGILQPRVGISVQSVARSRLARIYSGQTGLDIYSRAVSDVYQDLYGEGSYVGKGIYDVDIVHRVLDRRFPNNLLLSHDLIEGAYARSGLVSDIEIIEDYPSHYSAYNRRKHRWLRGDWQIIEWLLNRVPDRSGMRVTNPISLVSQWKILDNLRRGLVEPATFLLLLLGWLVLPGSPVAWTVATLALFFLPDWVRSIIQFIRATLEKRPEQARAVLGNLLTATIGSTLTLMFLAHQMLVSLDAMVRALIRRFFTGRKMLEWVTSAEEEMALTRRTPLDIYLDWTPALAFAIGGFVFAIRPIALLAALPVLALWASSKFISVWLNRPPQPSHRPETENEQLLLRGIGLRTWRYFADHSNESNHWLVPDNVREDPQFVDNRLSPTNLGFLLNARQSAIKLGYLTLPEFVDFTSKTLSSMDRLPKFRGHFYNWYDNLTLQALAPWIVSSVDSGNLVASLWTLEQGCLDQLRSPLIQDTQAHGLLDHLCELVKLRALPNRVVRNFARLSKHDWIEAFEDFPLDVLESKRSTHARADEASWFRNQAKLRIEHVRSTLKAFTPWLRPEFRPLEESLPGLDWGKWNSIALSKLPAFVDALQLEIALVSELPESTTFSATHRRSCQRLSELLPDARNKVVELIHQLETIASRSGDFAENTDFTFMLHPQRKQLSVSYDAASQKTSDACYDQLASESRMASFVAIAKNDIPQESWFTLGRRHKLNHGRIVLLSWAGTMFEYLMPTLWMETYPGTLLDRACAEAVHSQRKYAEHKHVPWGISESGYADRDPDGAYKYFAFGVSDLALRNEEDQSLVISPYSTLLALHIAPTEAFHNLRTMKRSDWLGSLGFYEAADYTDPVTKKRVRRPVLVKSWMAHHQGMSLLAIANFLCDGVMRRWFHKNPNVQATELLLQERPVTRMNLPSGSRRLAA
jgi:cyclic beta-1,2-glucan synthetase